jgi:predicted enzyme related to lactoylglutathione lyase
MMNVINWFEIPSTNFERAVSFYSALFGQPLRLEQADEIPNAILPYEQPGVGGAIVGNPHYTPSAGGTVIYLNTQGQLAAFLARVEVAGGQVLMPATSLGPVGTIAVILDSEGNRIGLHQEA